MLLYTDMLLTTLNFNVVMMLLKKCFHSTDLRNFKYKMILNSSYMVCNVERWHVNFYSILFAVNPLDSITTIIA